MNAVTTSGKLKCDGTACWLETLNSTAVDQLGAILVAQGQEVDILLADVPKHVGAAYTYFGNCRIEGEVSRVGHTHVFSAIHKLALRLDDFEYVVGDRGLSEEADSPILPSNLLRGESSAEEAAVYGVIAISSDRVAIADATDAMRGESDISVPCMLSQDALFDLDAHVPGDDQPYLPVKYLSAVVRGRVVRQDYQSVEVLPEVISMALTKRTVLRYYVPAGVASKG